MHRTSILLICLLFAATKTLVGQEATFVGIVTDSLTGDPLAGAFVSLVGHDMIVVTGMDGRFSLAGVGSGNVGLEVRRPGRRARRGGKQGRSREDQQASKTPNVVAWTSHRLSARIPGCRISF